MTWKPDEVSACGGEDVGGVRNVHRLANPVQNHKADSTFDDERMVTIGNNVAEAHTTNRVEGEPRFHTDVHRDPVEIERTLKRPVGPDDERRRPATDAGD